MYAGGFNLFGDYIENESLKEMRLKAIEEHIAELERERNDILNNKKNDDEKKNKIKAIHEACETMKHNMECEINRVLALVERYNEDYPNEFMHVNIEVVFGDAEDEEISD